MKPKWYELPVQRWQERRPDGERIWTDSQKNKLYTAERLFRGIYEGEIKKFSTQRVAQEYVDEFIASEWVAQRFGKQESVQVSLMSRTYCDSSQPQRKVRLSPWGMNEVVALHELCHILQPHAVGTPHGRFFARNLLESVGYKLGSRAMGMLRDSYVTFRVKCTPKPVYSKETKAKMRAIGLKRAAALGWS